MNWIYFLVYQYDNLNELQSPIYKLNTVYKLHTGSPCKIIERRCVYLTLSGHTG